MREVRKMMNMQVMSVKTLIVSTAFSAMESK